MKFSLKRKTADPGALVPAESAPAQAAAEAAR